MLATAEADIKMSLEEFEMIRDFIHERSGMFFAENKMYLVKNRLAKRMNELAIKSVRDYFYHVKYDVSLKEFNKLMDLVTTNETSFFRNEPQLLSFAEEVLPLMIKEKADARGPKTLKIWSAGCSTGEEPYTLAMILMEKIPTMAGWTIEIIANDIAEEVLQKARKGEYSGLTLRNVRPDILAKYYTKNGDMYVVKPEVKALVKFSHMNLNDPRRISVMGNLDTVFCRNVMIYFSDEVKKQLVRGFFNALRPGGYFYVGHSETLHGISKAFKLVYFKNALVYQKEAIGANKADAATGGARTSTGIPLKRPAAGSSTHTAAGTGTRTTAGAGANRALELLRQIKPMSVKK